MKWFMFAMVIKANGTVLGGDAPMAEYDSMSECWDTASQYERMVTAVGDGVDFGKAFCMELDGENVPPLS